MSSLTHLNSDGEANMVNVSEKNPSQRLATARGRMNASPEVVAALRDSTLKKGDAISVARIAGIMAAKRTWELIPLCHPIALSRIDLDFTIVDDGVEIEATVGNCDRTGVEMEALTAVSVAGLTLIDMVKALDPGSSLNGIEVVEKRGGKTGLWQKK